MSVLSPVVPAEKPPQSESLSGSIFDIVTHNSMSSGPFFIACDSYSCVVLSLLTMIVIQIDICLVGPITALLSPKFGMPSMRKLREAMNTEISLMEEVAPHRRKSIAKPPKQRQQQRP